jgi:hypothetical protein
MCVSCSAAAARLLIADATPSFPPFFSPAISTMMRAKIAAKEDQNLHIGGSKFASLLPRPNR